MAKKKKTPKLICKTPWLKRDSYWGSWCGPDIDNGQDWLCIKTLGRLFHLPAKDKRIRAMLYSSRPTGNDSMLLRFVLKSRWPDTIEYLRVNWGTGKRSNIRGVMHTEAENLLRATILKDCEIGTIKEAWLEIEIED